MTPDINEDIYIEYEESDGNYFIVWRPIVTIGSGATGKEALEDLRKAAHLGIDTILNKKLEELS